MTWNESRLYTAALRKNSRTPLRSTPVLGTIALLIVAAMVTFPARIPGMPGRFRTTELVSVIAIIFLIRAFAIGQKVCACTPTLLVVGGLSLSWIAIEVLNYMLQPEGSRSRMIVIRWILGFPVAYWFVVLMGNRHYRGKVVFGLIVGSVLALGSLIHDDLTFDPNVPVSTLDDKQPPVWIYGKYRASGIFSHPNAAAATILLVVPLFIGMIEESRFRRSAVAVPIAILGIVYTLTLTRGPSLVAAGVVCWHLLGRTAQRKVFASLILILTLVSLAFVADSMHSAYSIPSLERIFDFYNIEAGAGDRIRTTLASLEIVLTHPLGVGSRYEQMLESTTGFTATHNGYVQLALLGGLPLTLLVTFCLLRQARGLWQPSRKIEYWTSAYVVCILLFENQFFVPTFIAVALWLVCRPESLNTESAISSKLGLSSLSLSEKCAMQAAFRRDSRMKSL